MIESVIQSIQKHDLAAALISMWFITFPYDIITPVLKLSHLSPVSVASLSLVITLSGFFLFLRQYRAFRSIGWIPVFALIVSSTVAAAEITRVPEETFFGWRILGAALGSTVFTIFKHRRKGDLKAAGVMFSIGLAIGFVSSRYIMDKMGWINASDYWLMASGIGGVIGYMALDILYVHLLKTKRAAADE